MSEEIIKLIEYLTGNEVVQGMFWVYIIFGIIITIVTLAIIIFTFIHIIKSHKEMDRHFKNFRK